MNALRNMAISASAGTGKTFRLAHRYLALMAQGCAPDRICALTFSRKAAGEIFDAIVERLCLAATDDRERALTDAAIAEFGVPPPAAAGPYGALLRRLLDHQHRLRVGTLDSFILGVVRAFPLELGIPSDLQPMDGDGGDAEAMRLALFARLFDPGRRPDYASDLLRAFQQTAHGRSGKTLAERLDRLVVQYHAGYRAHATRAWGDAERIWTPQQRWWTRGARTPAPPDLPERLAAAFGGGGHDAQLGAAVAAVAAAALAHAPDRPWPGDKLSAKVFGQLLASAKSGAFEVNYHKKDYTLTDDLWHPLRSALCHMLGVEIERVCLQTAARREVLARYDALYAETARAEGRFTFEDLSLLLGAPPNLPGRNPGAPDRLYIDFRLDGELDHWLLDEFQDTSDTQWASIANLVDETVGDPERCFFYVGDVKQSIYGWRGGNHTLFGAVLDRYRDHGERAVELSSIHLCRRARRAVVDTVNRVFDDLPAWQPASGGGPRPEAVSAFTAHWQPHRSAHPQPGYAALIEYDPRPAARPPAGEDAEAESADPAVYEAVADILRAADPAANRLSAAVLVRQNSEGHACVNVLRKRLPELPAAHEGTGGIVDHPAVVLLLSLARYAAHPGNLLALRHLQMSPLARRGRLADPDALRRSFLTDAFEEGYAAALRNAAAGLDGDCDDFGRARLRALFDAAEAFDAGGSRDADAFCAHVEAWSVRSESAAGSVRVMTVHQSKGLGFDLVIVPFGARDRSFGAPAAPALLAGEDWVLEPPLASVREAAGGPPEEAWQAAQARANFEQLCVLYVAMTRAAHALYMLVPAPPKSPSASRPADLLRERLGGDAAPPAAESGTRLLYEHGDRDWRLHARRAAADEAPRAAPAPTPVAWVAEPRRVEPSKESWSRTALRAAWLFEQEASDVRAFGSALHRLFQAVTWSDDLDIESVIAHWRAGSGEPEAVLRDAEIQFRACLAVPEIARCLARPAAGAEVWNEAAFDVVFDTGGERRILSGRFDRLVVERAADGRPARATVVDFKSDRVETGAQVAARAGEHEPQMRDYMRAAARLLGLPAESVQGRLVFTRPARIADVAPPACGGASA